MWMRSRWFGLGCIMDRLFVEALWLWTTVPPYSGFPCSTVANRLLPAVRYKRILGCFREDGSVCAFATWGFMTDVEYETRVYSGPEVFAREDGDRLVVVDMIAAGGRSDVVLMTRALRRHFKSLYPWHDWVYAHRGPRNGFFPNKG
jgi:hemolysin-activating ACP:hemolysin acyltransferase